MKKRNNSKYVFVDGNDTERISYVVKREFAFNDYDNVYYEDGYENLDLFFEENNIPPKYRKLILKLNGNIMYSFKTRHSIEEFFTKKKFTLKKVYHSDVKTYISGDTDTYDITELVKFTTELDIVNYDEVLYFLCDLNNLGLLDNYFHAIMSFFRIKMSKEYQKNEPSKLKRSLIKWVNKL